MKKSLASIFLALVLFAVLPATLAALPYDSTTVKNSMRRNAGDLGKIQPAIDAKDYTVLAETFSDFLATGTSLKAMDPPKGDPGMWQGFWNDFIAAASKGLAAAKDKDLAKASEALATLRSIMGQGHKSFRF